MERLSDIQLFLKKKNIVETLWRKTRLPINEIQDALEENDWNELKAYLELHKKHPNLVDEE